MSDDPAEIWLEPGAGDPDTGRLWCQDDAWTGTEGYKQPATRYIRADLCRRIPRIVEDTRVWCAGYDDGWHGRPHGTSPLSGIDALAYASGFIEGKAAANKGETPTHTR